MFRDRKLERDKATFRDLADHISGRVNDPAGIDLATMIGGGLIAAALCYAIYSAAPEIAHIVGNLQRW